MADAPRRIDSPEYRLAVNGLVDRPLSLTAAELDAGDALEATLDCTGGFYSRQRWRGIGLGRVVDRAAPKDDAGYVRVISHTGYRWSFSLADARGLLLATRVGDELLAHEHGAPARLVAAGSARLSVGEVGHAHRAARRPGRRSGCVDGVELVHSGGSWRRVTAKRRSGIAYHTRRSRPRWRRS